MKELVDGLDKVLLGNVQLGSMAPLKLSKGKLIQEERVSHKGSHCLAAYRPGMLD